MKLFKYIKSEYLPSFVEKGELYFRNLSYFKKYENKHRNDCFEGMHRDNPDTDITIQNLTKGFTVKGNYTFVNRVYSDEIFIFCFSKVLDKSLFEKFECDSCVEISDTTELFRRLRKRLIPGKSINKEYGLIFDDVIYYEKSKAVESDIHDARRIAFLKDISYSDQQEYRIAFGKGNNCMKTIKQIMTEKYDYEEESKNVFGNSIRTTIGNIQDISKINYLD